MNVWPLVVFVVQSVGFQMLGMRTALEIPKLLG
jgi:hypothetical protein